MVERPQRDLLNFLLEFSQAKGNYYPTYQQNFS